MCCSVLQCAAVCCSVLQCDLICCAVCCSVLERWSSFSAVCVAAYCSVLQHIAVYCSVLQCIAVCCSVLQCVAERNIECFAFSCAFGQELGVGCPCNTPVLATLE